METIDNALSTVFRNKYSSTLITMFLVFYSGLAAPKLPNFVVGLFENPIFRILILSLIVYNGNRDPQFAIMIAVGFTVTMNIISKQKLFEGFADNDLSADSDLGLIDNDGAEPPIDTQTPSDRDDSNAAPGTSEGNQNGMDNTPDNSAGSDIVGSNSDDSGAAPGTTDSATQ